MVWLLILTVFAVIFITIFFLTIRIMINYERMDGNDQLIVSISTLHGIIRYSKTLRLNVIQDPPQLQGKEGKKSGALSILKRFKGIQLFDVMKAFMKIIRCDHIRWKTVVGTDDAAETATVVGWLWGIKTSITAFLARHIQMNTVPKISIFPHYSGSRLQCHFSCIVVFRLDQAMIVGVRMLVQFLRGRSQKKWQTTPSKV